MSFWDASAVVPLLVDEAGSTAMRAQLAEHPELMVWWGTAVECVSAVGRRERTDVSAAEKTVTALETLAKLESEWIEIPPTLSLRNDARRLVRVHDLRAADALQLAAARVAADGDPGTLPFVTLDERLTLAARREGFPVLGLE